MRIRRGMWVMWHGHIGILHTFDPLTGRGEVHLTCEKGYTSTIVPDVSLQEVRQATYFEIPERRRPDSHLAVRLGYRV